LNGMQFREAWLSNALQLIDQHSKTIEELQKAIAEKDKRIAELEKPPIVVQGTN
jgi:ParB-like chromosome segregation protein Spo0J